MTCSRTCRTEEPMNASVISRSVDRRDHGRPTAELNWKRNARYNIPMTRASVPRSPALSSATDRGADDFARPPREVPEVRLLERVSRLLRFLLSTRRRFAGENCGTQDHHLMLRTSPYDFTTAYCPPPIFGERAPARTCITRYGLARTAQQSHTVPPGDFPHIWTAHVYREVTCRRLL